MSSPSAPPADASASPAKPESNPFNDPKALAAMGLERTNNKTGFMFLNIDDSINYWLNSMPHSSKPLVDLGAAYGIHTIHALKAGRDVISVDMDEVHISKLRERVDKYLKSTAAQQSTSPGRLVDSLIATLPDSTVFQDESVAGVLLSEVLHFMKPGQPQPLFEDVYRWLEPGGKMVVTMAASKEEKVQNFAGKMGFELNNDRTVDEVNNMIATASSEELANEAPAYMELPASSPFRAAVCGSLYLMCAKELKVFAKRAGFQIEKCTHISPDKYPDAKIEGETVLLVARKPDPRRQRQTFWAVTAAAAAVASVVVLQLCRKL